MYCYANFYCFRTKISGGGGQKCLHLSRGLLRNETEVKCLSVGSTMISIVGELLKHIANLSTAVASEHIDVVITHD